MKSITSTLLAISCLCSCALYSEYQAKAFDHLKHLEGFSPSMMENHLKLYNGYVTQSNKLFSLLGNKDLTNPEKSELRRRLGWEIAGMRLHELYFENLGRQTLSTTSALKNAIEKQFDSWQAWQADFESTGAMRGIGWAILYWDPVGKKFINAWIGEHDWGQLTGCIPLLVMDVWEHAYMSDYQIDRPGYIQNFMKEVNWEVVESRWNQGSTRRE